MIFPRIALVAATDCSIIMRQETDIDTVSDKKAKERRPTDVA